jgi:hypothetical protein
MGQFSIVYEDFPECQCLCLVVSGHYAPGPNKNAISAVSSVMKELGYKKVLLDFRKARHSMSILDIYDRPKYYMEENLSRGIKIAFVYNPETIDTDLNFTETVLANNGWIMRKFQDMDTAFDWLGS